MERGGHDGEPDPSSFLSRVRYDPPFLILVPTPDGAVARADETTAIRKVGGLGLHPRMRQRRSRTRSR